MPLALTGVVVVPEMMNALAASCSLLLAATAEAEISRAMASQFDPTEDQHDLFEYPEFGVTTGDGRRDLVRRGLRFGLGFHGLADAEAVEHVQDVSSGCAFRHEGDGLRVEQGLFHGIRCG